MAAIYGGNRKPSVIATAVMIERLGRVLFARKSATKKRNEGRKGTRMGQKEGEDVEKDGQRTRALLAEWERPSYMYVPGISARLLFIKRVSPRLISSSSHFLSVQLSEMRHPRGLSSVISRELPDNQHKSCRTL